jgi:hypothetical protein
MRELFVLFFSIAEMEVPLRITSNIASALSSFSIVIMSIGTTARSFFFLSFLYHSDGRSRRHSNHRQD